MLPHRRRRKFDCQIRWFSQPSRPAVEDLQGFSPLGRIDMESLQLKQYAHRLTKILISRLQQPALLYPCRLSEKGHRKPLRYGSIRQGLRRWSRPIGAKTATINARVKTLI
jgi:hypothetical protein